MRDDAELLADYAANRSEPAFAELVSRHLGLVYAVALRQLRGDAHLAQDVSQQVFIALARKALPLSHHPVVSGWLHRTTRYCAIDALRREQGRSVREEEASHMIEPTRASTPDSANEALRLVIDEVIEELDDRDRDAVTLRYFENQPFAAIGRKLSLSENAARMRVDRALDKLGGLLAKRGITSSAAALNIALLGQAGSAAPAGLAASVVSGALASTGATASAAAAATTLFTMANIQTGIVAAIAVGGIAAIIYQHRTNASLSAELDSLKSQQSELIRLESENRQLEAEASEVESYRNDDAELARLQNQVKSLAAELNPTPTPGINQPLAGPVFEAADVEVLPQPLVQQPPVFPVEMRRAGIGGEVVVQFVVDTDGNVRDSRVSSASDPAFSDSALQAVSKWKFKPAARGGQPVNVRLTVPLAFSIASPGSARQSADRSPPPQSWFLGS